MRNFWIETHIDGRKNPVTGGPRSKKGGFNLDISMRDDGKSFKALSINGIERDGVLILNVQDSFGETVYEFITTR